MIWWNWYRELIREKIKDTRLQILYYCFWCFSLKTNYKFHIQLLSPQKNAWPKENNETTEGKLSDDKQQQNNGGETIIWYSIAELNAPNLCWCCWCCYHFFCCWCYGRYCVTTCSTTKFLTKNQNKNINKTAWETTVIKNKHWKIIITNDEYLITR